MNKQLQSKHQTTRKLDRRNAIKNIDYDATSSPSSSFSDIIPSFRVEGVDGDFDLICRSLGLSGPEDFAIPAAAWEARKSPQGFGNGRNSKSCELGSSRNSEDFSVVDAKIGSLGFDNRNSKSCELGSSRNSEEFSVTSFDLKDKVDAKINEKGFDSRNSISCDLASNRNSQNFRATSSNRDDLLGSIEAKIFDKPNSKSYELANNRKSQNFRATSSNRDDYLYTVESKVRVSGNERNKKGFDNRNLGFCEWPYNQNKEKIRFTSSNRNDFLDTVEDKIRVSENEKKNDKFFLGELANNQIREKSGVTGSNGDGLSDTVEATIGVRENEKGFDYRNFGSCELANNQKSGITGLCRDDLFDTIEATFRVGGNEGNENGFSQAETGVRVRHCNEVKCELGSHRIFEKNGVIDSNWENNSLKISEPNVRVRESKKIEYDFAPGVIEVRVRRTDECFSVRSFRSGGIKGARPPLLAPPPVISPSQNTDYTSSSWDLLKSFGPPSDEVSGSFIGNSLIEKETTIENREGNDRRRQDVDGEWLGDIRVVTESFLDTSEDKDDDTNVKMETLHFVSPLGNFKCTINSWQKGDFLGSGSFGTVYEGFTDDGIFFAVKEVSLLDQGDQGKQSIYQLEQEIFFLSQFEHENIVQYLGTDKDNGKLYIFLELVTKGSLASLYQKYNLQDSQVSAYTRQILNGLNYLHLRKVVHRDIKCANILVDASGSVKLADFGLAKATNLNDVKSCKGTAFWMAPEVVNRKNHGYGLAADIWSLGCTVLEMLTRRIPYSHLEGMQALFRIGKGEPPPVPNSLSREAQDFISKCLRVNPDDRPTAAQLLNHPFVKRPLTTFSAPASPFYHATRS